MKISELGAYVALECIQDSYADRELAGGYTSDLLSDVMANAKERSVLVTIQAHKNTVAVATLVDINAIIICSSRPVPSDMVEAARNEQVALFATSENQFAVSGRLYAAFASSAPDRPQENQAQHG